MSKDAELQATERSTVSMEDFGRFNPAKKPDAHEETSEEEFDDAYAEENAGA